MLVIWSVSTIVPFVNWGANNLLAFLMLYSIVILIKRMGITYETHKSEFKALVLIPYIVAVISIIVVAAMVLFDMLYMIKDKKEELPQEEKKVEEIVWITESSIEGVQSEMVEALNALLKKRGCEYKVRFVCFPMETYEEDVAEYLENNSADIFYSNLRVV